MLQQKGNDFAQDTADLLGEELQEKLLSMPQQTLEKVVEILENQCKINQQPQWGTYREKNAHSIDDLYQFWVYTIDDLYQALQFFCFVLFVFLFVYLLLFFKVKGIL